MSHNKRNTKSRKRNHNTITPTKHNGLYTTPNKKRQRIATPINSKPTSKATYIIHGKHRKYNISYLTKINNNNNPHKPSKHKTLKCPLTPNCKYGDNNTIFTTNMALKNHINKHLDNNEQIPPQFIANFGDEICTKCNLLFLNISRHTACKPKSNIMHNSTTPIESKQNNTSHIEPNPNNPLCINESLVFENNDNEQCTIQHEPLQPINIQCDIDNMANHESTTRDDKSGSDDDIDINNYVTIQQPEPISVSQIEPNVTNASNNINDSEINNVNQQQIPENRDPTKQLIEKHNNEEKYECIEKTNNDNKSKTTSQLNANAKIYVPQRQQAINPFINNSTFLHNNKTSDISSYINNYNYIQLQHITQPANVVNTNIFKYLQLFPVID